MPVRSAVPFLDLAEDIRNRKGELRSAIDGVLESGIFLDGPQLRAFEDELGQRLGGSRVVGVGSGTQALQILLLAHGIGPGDDVVTTAASFFATGRAIALVGARPVFADVRPEDYNLDADSVRAAITDRTKAVLAVHLYGRPADTAALRRVAAEHRVLFLEDCAQAMGAGVAGRPTGTLGDGAAFSFYPTKNLGALGDAGAVVVADPEVAERARSARFLGFSGRRDEFDRPGISGRMDEIQAACLRVRLRHFDADQAVRAGLAAAYRERLPSRILPGPAPNGVIDAHHLFVIGHPERQRIAEELARSGIQTQIHYRVPLHRQPGAVGSAVLPVAERWAREVLSLPLNLALTPEAVGRIADTVTTAVR